MLFKQHVVSGGYASNCYILGCEETKEAVVIDPGGDGAIIATLLKKDGLTAKYIINTHGHIDHIAGNTEVKEKTGAQILIHTEDKDMLTEARRNLSGFMGASIVSPPADGTLEEGEIITVGTTIKLEVIHTPGHTRGGICLKVGDVVFTGDTLFAGSIGRSDFPGGDHNTLISSIKAKLLILEDDTEVFPGHGPSSTIGEERASNPFLG
jgi:glyoxylase-like metal-dependent hydrolase (beta-lactamase superfamily II)